MTVQKNATIPSMGYNATYNTLEPRILALVLTVGCDFDWGICFFFFFYKSFTFSLPLLISSNYLSLYLIKTPMSTLHFIKFYFFLYTKTLFPTFFTPIFLFSFHSTCSQIMNIGTLLTILMYENFYLQCIDISVLSTEHRLLC